MIPQQILDKFKKLYLQDYGIHLTDAEALEKCTALFSGLDVLFKQGRSRKKPKKTTV